VPRRYRPLPQPLSRALPSYQRHRLAKAWWRGNGGVFPRPGAWSVAAAALTVSISGAAESVEVCGVGGGGAGRSDLRHMGLDGLRPDLPPRHRPRFGSYLDLPRLFLHNKASRASVLGMAVVAASSTGGGRPEFCVYTAGFHDPISSPRWRGVAAGENQARLRSWWTMMAPTRHYLVEGILNVAFMASPHPGYSWGNPRSGSPDRTMATLGAVLPLRASFL
jgi:hypothetical protein